MSETKVFHQLELMYNLKQDVDYIVRQLNQQNRLISRMRRFQRYCKDFLGESNQIGLKRFDLEYTKFDRDYRHLNRVCQKMNRKLYSSLIYDKILDLFVSLREDCAEIDGGGGGQDASVNDDQCTDNIINGDNGIENYDNSGCISDLSTVLDSDEFDEDNSDVSVGKRKKEDTIVVDVGGNNENYDNSGYIDSDQSTELDSDEFEEDNSDVSVGERNKEGTIVVDAQQSTPINKKIVKVLENVAVVTNEKLRKMLKCDIKGCKFVSKWQPNLNRHKLRVHNISKRPFEDCGRISRSLNAKRHKNIHNKQCSWPGCPKWFGTNKELKDHHQIHHSYKRYRCKWPDCHFSSSYRPNVIKHIRARHLNLPETKKQQLELNIPVDPNAPREADFVEDLPDFQV